MRFSAAMTALLAAALALVASGTTLLWGLVAGPGLAVLGGGVAATVVARAVRDRRGYRAASSTPAASGPGQDPRSG